MNVFEDLIGELKEEQLLEDTVIKVRSAVDGPRSADSDEFSFEIDGEDFVLEDEPDADHLTAPTVVSGSNDFFRKRAMDEVSALQMVEHVLAGIERQHNITPSGYDDFEAKKALHRFLQTTAEPSSAEYAEVEAELLGETQAWSAALCRRDEAISLADLRKFCENCRPVLSSQALIALSRFYRNCPFTEQGRKKFEYVMTRLFSREVEDHKRKLLFDRVEMIGHVRNLYAKWSSVSMFDAGEEETAIEALVRNFADSVNKARSFRSFEDLVEGGFFQNLNALKESSSELFFVPEITAATIECNVRVGNRLIDLTANRDSYSDLETLGEKYGSSFDDTLSEATGRSLNLIGLLRTGADAASAEAEGEAPAPLFPIAPKPVEAEEPRRASLRVNKWLLVATVLIAAISIGLYVWADRASAPDGSTLEATKVDLATTDLASYLRTGRATGTTFYAVTLPAWDTLSEQQKKDVVEKAVIFAGKMRLSKVQLLNFKGRSVAFGSPEKIELIEQ